ncbi:MAG TPA: hypothetical protein ENJ83_04330 [Rhodospirillales bacterium]|nr:hypothetical protein [Rhodospirillales bacterium]
MKLPPLFARALLVLGLLTPFALHAQPSEQQRLVERARVVVDDFRGDPNFASAAVYVQNAYAVVVVPNLVEGGFIIGGKYGVGVLLARDVQTGEWSDPVFMTLAGATVGFQIGGKATDMLITVMNEAAVSKLLDQGLKLGADASAAVGPVGGGVGAGTTTNFGEDVYVFARNVGLFAGLTVEGMAIFPKHDWNEAYYGRKVTPKEIIAGAVSNPGADPLREALAAF